MFQPELRQAAFTYLDLTFRSPLNDCITKMFQPELGRATFNYVDLLLPFEWLNYKDVHASAWTSYFQLLGPYIRP